MKILIATDGSEFGTSAVRFAPHIVDGHAKTELKLVTVIEPAAGTELETIIESTDELKDPGNPAEQKAAAMLSQAQDELLEKYRDREFAISSKVLAGPAARSIVEEAERWG